MISNIVNPKGKFWDASFRNISVRGHHVSSAIPKKANPDDESAREVIGVWHPESCDGSCQEAAQAFEHFHGKRPSFCEDLTINWPPVEALRTHFKQPKKLSDDVAALGFLLELVYRVKDTKEKAVMKFQPPYPFLACDNYGDYESEILLVTGGEYQLPAQEGLFIGMLTQVSYETVKSFDEFQPTIYDHEFDEPGPILCMSPGRKQLYIFRGRSEFFIDVENEVSAGIVG